MTYLFSVLHFVGLIFWVGGLLYGTRLLAFHVKQLSASENQEMHKALSSFGQKLFTFAIHPGLVLTQIGGWGLLLVYGFAPFKVGAFHPKFTIAFIVFPIFHYLFWKKAKEVFASELPLQPTKLFNIIHGLTGVLLLVLLYFAAKLPPFAVPM